MQQSRTVEWDDVFPASCPFAFRVPKETWVLPINHHYAFEEDMASRDLQLRFGRCLNSVLRRLESVTHAYQLVLHTSPNVAAKFEKAGDWQILTADYRWHFEVLPVSPSNFKSYSVKEV